MIQPNPDNQNHPQNSQITNSGSPSSDTTSSPKPFTSNRIPMKMKLKIKTLYLKKDYQPSQIAQELKLPLKQVQSFVYRSGLSKQKKQVMERVDEIATAEASILNEHAEFAQEISDEAQAMILEGFDGAVTAKDGKDFAGWASGTKTFYDIYRKAQGLDGQVSNAIAIGIKVVCDQPIRTVSETK